LTGSVNYKIEIQASNSILEGNANTMTGPGVSTGNDAIKITAGGVRVQNVILQSWNVGVRLGGGASTVTNVTVRATNYGIYLGSAGNKILRCDIQALVVGVLIYRSDNNEVSNNRITGQWGISFEGGSGNRLMANEILNGDIGINITSAAWTSTGNELAQNNIHDNRWCGFITLSAHNRVRLYQNNFVNNGSYQGDPRKKNIDVEAGALGIELTPLGNFYSNHNNTDSNGDGFADQLYPYYDGNLPPSYINFDRYPLARPFNLPPPLATVTVPPGISLEEGETYELPVMLSFPSSSTVTVHYQMRNGTATDADYVASSGTVTFAPTEVVQFIPLQIKRDALEEAEPEVFYVDITEPIVGAILGSPRTSLVTIIDGEAVILVPNPPPFSFTPEGPARHICLPPYMVWDPTTTHYWWAKAAGSGDLVIDFVAFCVNTAERGEATVTVFTWPGNVPVVTHTVVHPFSSAGAEAHAPAIILPSPPAGEIFRIEVRVAPGSPGIDPARHYRMEFDGASLVATNSPQQAQPEHDNARWGFNVLAGEGGTIVVNSAPEAGATSATVRVEDPIGGTYATTALGLPVNIPPTSPAGMWKVTVMGANGHYVIDKSGGSDLGLYVGPFSDIEPPHFTSVPGNLEFPTEPGKCSRVVNFDVRASDNCGLVDITATPPSGSEFSKGPTTVLVRATDGAGNFVERTFTITVKDGERPTIIVPPTVVESVTDPGKCAATVDVLSKIAATDNCEVASVTWTPAGNSFPKGETIVNVTATDGSGNANTNSFKIVVKDVEPPALTVPDPMIVRNDPGKCEAVVNFSVNAVDNCGGGTVTAVPASGTVFPVGTTTVSVTASDGSGNSVTKSFTVTVKDVEPPTLTVPEPLTFHFSQYSSLNGCGFYVGEGMLVAEVSDNCGGAAVTREGVPPGNLFPVGKTVVTYKARDAAGNEIVKTQTVEVIDDVPPQLTAPPSITVNTGGGATTCDAVVDPGLLQATASDNCPVTTTRTPEGNRFPVGATTITYTATDASGNRTSATQVVTVVDNTPPTLTVPGSVTVYTGAGATSCSAGVPDAQLGQATATDNCGGLVNIIRSGVPTGNVFPVGASTITYTATDVNGNSVSLTQTVTVLDNTPPTLTVPANIVVGNDAGKCSAVVNFTVTAADNCSGVTVTSTPASGTAFERGTTPVTVEATDGAGNKSQGTFTVTVEDREAPKITCPANITVKEEFGKGYAVVNYDAPTVTDNCSATVSCLPQSGSQFPVGTTEVTCTATDDAGNKATCTFKVTVSKIQCFTMVSVDANFTGKGWKGAKQVPVKGVKVVMLPKGPVQSNVQNLLDAQSVWAKLSVINAVGDPVFETDATGKVMVQSSVADPNGWAVYIDLTNASGAGVTAPAITKGTLKIAVANSDCAPQKKFTVKLESDLITTTASFDRQANLSTSGAEGDVMPEQEAYASVPTEFALYEAYPNPFNPTTTIQYDIAEVTQVRLAVYDLMGREVKILVDGERSPGRYSAVFNAEGLPSGMYFYHLRAGNFSSIRKLLLLK
jgi:hypothetical protein